MGRISALLNQKGGVGKTTVTLGLASAAAHAGHRVLVVDLDPQGSSTWVLGHDPATEQPMMIVPSHWGPEVDLVASSPGMGNSDHSRTESPHHL
ncbi:MAG: ParA family protein, partial [Ilumatobacteraceae bacterium]